MLKRLTFMLATLLSFAAVSVHAQDAGEAVGIDSLCGDQALTIVAKDTLPEDEQTQALDTLLRQIVTLPTDELPPLSSISQLQRPPAPGAVIFVDSPDGRYFRSIGAANIETCAPIDPTTPFPIGSNTKMMTAAVIYQLQEEGKLATSDLVSKYLPDEIALWDGAESITIDMLLSHTSGLPDYLNSYNEATVGGQFQADDWGNLGQAFTPEELVAMSAVEPLVFAPGAEGRWTYSNTAYIMLGQIIEQVTGQSYFDAVDQRIIQPLGLEHTVLVPDIAPADLGLTAQYLKSPFTRETSTWNFSQAWSAGAAVSTAEDMAVFLRALYSGALYEDPATLAAMLTPASPGYVEQTDNFYYMHGGYYKGGFLGHGGQTLGTESDVGFNPELDTVIISWANSSESYIGQGIFYVGAALGLTPSLDEEIAKMQGNAEERESSTPDYKSLSISDVVGVTFNSNGVYLGSSQETRQVAEGSTYSVVFNADGTMNIVADCNTAMATYTTSEDGAIRIELGAGTLVACGEDSIADDFLAVLAETSRMSAQDLGPQLLIILSADDGSNIVLSANK